MSASAIIPAVGDGALAPLNIERALALIRDSRDIQELAELRDWAQATQRLAKARDVSLEAQQAAGELKVRAEWKLGKLLEEQQETGARQRRGDAGRAAANRPKGPEGPLVEPPKTLDELGIKKKLARKAQLVAKQPEAKLDGYIEAAREQGVEITTAGLLNHASRRNPHAASRVNDGEPEKNERYTRKKLREALQARFRFEVDAFGCEAAPMSKLIGTWYTKRQDAFAQDFSKRRTFFQPPWDLIAETVELIHGQAEKGMPLGVLLMPANREEQPFWHRFIEPYRPDRGGSGVRVEFLEGREHYGNPDDPECEDMANQNAGMPSCIVIWEGPRRRSLDNAIDSAALASEPRASTSPLGSLLSSERFEMEAGKLRFSIRPSPHFRPSSRRPRTAHCTRPGCRARPLTFRATQEGLLRRSDLDQLREHARSHVGRPAKKGRKR